MIEINTMSRERSVAVAGWFGVRFMACKVYVCDVQIRWYTLLGQKTKFVNRAGYALLRLTLDADSKEQANNPQPAANI